MNIPRERGGYGDTLYSTRRSRSVLANMNYLQEGALSDYGAYSLISIHFITNIISFEF